MRILLFLGFFAALPAAAGERDIELSHLPEGSVATINFSSSGCFHNYAVRYVFTAKDVTIFKLKYHWDSEKKKSVSTLIEKVGALQLSRHDLKKLDQTLDWYRNVKPGGCTTIDRLAIRVTSGKNVIAEENLTDATCSIDNQIGMLQLNKLNQRLSKQLKRKKVKVVPKKKKSSK